ncbi:MAG TPA: hypothetical protein VFP84_07830 [Kofleriaceae bacterium]|nr:hypothetical protein [Kofleriaceae bacterium]
MTRPTVVIELAGDAQFARDLAVGGVFVPGCTLRLTDECELVVRGPHQQISLPARVVYVEEQRGAGLELIGFSSETKAQLAQLAPIGPSELVVLDEPPISEASLVGIDLAGLRRLEEEQQQIHVPVESVALIDIEALAEASELDDLAIDDDAHGGARFFSSTAATRPPANADDEDQEDAADDDGTPSDDDAVTLAPDSEGDDRLDELAGALAHAEATAEGTAKGTDDGRRGERARHVARNVHERLRGLTLALQIKVASTGELHERIVLERLYGKNVWETLLRNPRLTAPEIARIARMGTLPRVLLEVIVTNNAWLQIPEVRRALLANPRLATDQIVKVLRVTPKHELRLAAVQTAYPFAVRNAAKQLLRAES